MEETVAPKPPRTNPLLIGIALSSFLGAVLFSLTYSGTLLSTNVKSDAELVDDGQLVEDSLARPAFVPIETLLISIGGQQSDKQLRFEGFIETQDAHEEEILTLMPRIMDALNTYLRAIDVTNLEEPSALLKIRLHMLKRIQLVVGKSKVNDLLISQFVLS